MKITHATKRIQQHIKMHVLYMANINLECADEDKKIGHGHVPGNHPWDDIAGFKVPIAAN